MYRYHFKNCMKVLISLHNTGPRSEIQRNRNTGFSSQSSLLWANLTPDTGLRIKISSSFADPGTGGAEIMFLINSVGEPEPPLLGRLRNRGRFFFFGWSREPELHFLRRLRATSFRQAKGKSLVLVSNMTLRAV